jgi:XTP/dITP diphosphohydrolase
MEKQKIFIATANANKVREFRELLEPRGYEVSSILDLQKPFDIEENGTTFAENAVIKAEGACRKLQIPCLADDSGLEIDALNKEPGIYSARWLGHDTSYDYKNQVVLERMQGKKDRACRYVCAIALAKPNAETVVFEDTCEAVIAEQPSGKSGFGFDPIIYYEPLKMTMAEMTPEQKNAISHRGKAMRKMEAYLDAHQS